ncbi:MAG: GNAT family N-acetyltransferase [bacterium]|nr:GNAT family N-acetyltransferase [bacterium]
MDNVNLRKLNHRREAMALQIHRLSQSAYQIEAELLGVTEFPPLNRTVDDILNSSSQFFGCTKNNDLVAAVEIENTGHHHIHIAGLVVSPDCFRQGLGRRLVLWTLEQIKWKVATVSTDSANIPAIRLYEKLGFQKSSQRRLDENFTIVTLSMSSS